MLTRFDIRLSSHFCLGLVASLWGVSCGGAPPPSAQSQSGSCPEGQRFDGTYCVFDGSTVAAGGGAPIENEASGGNAVSGGVAPSENTGGSSGIDSVAVGGGQGELGGTGGAAVEPEGAVTPVSGARMAVPVDISMASAAGPLIQYIAATHVPAGARPYGAPFAGQFTEGQALQQRVQLTVGNCYTVLAAAPAPVREVRIGFFAVDPKDPTRYLEPALVQDTDTGPQAVLGRKEQCFRPAAEQRDLWLVLFVDKGQGVAAAQVFEKGL